MIYFYFKIYHNKKMWIYILNVLLLIVYSFLIKDKKKYIIFSSIQCFLILALRANTLGADANYYNNGYEYISKLSFWDMLSRLHLFKAASLIYPFKFESGYVFINWIVSHLGLSFHFFTVVCAGLNMYCFGKIIYKYSKNPCLSFVIFTTFGTYFYFFSILRQSLALSFFMISFMFAIDGKKKKSFLTYIITFIFHRASIVLLPMLLLANRDTKIKRKTAFFLFLLTFPFMIFSRYLLNYAQIVVNYLGGASYVGGNFTLNNLLILLYIILLLAIVFSNFKKNADNKLFSVLLWGLIISVYLDIMGQYNEVWERSVQMYTPFLILLIPMVTEQYNKQKAIYLINFCVGTLLIGYMCYYLSNSCLIPYKLQTQNLIFENETAYKENTMNINVAYKRN